MAAFFKTSLDTLSKVTTIIATVIFAAVIGGNVVLFQSGEHIVSVLAILLIGGVYISLYLFRVTGYGVQDGLLIIHRPIKNKIYSLDAIARGRRLTKGELSWTLRTFGNGGLFGYTGHFTNAKVGAMQWFATRLDKAVLLQTSEGKNIVLTPDEPDAFLQALHK